MQLANNMCRHVRKGLLNREVTDKPRDPKMVGYGYDGIQTWLAQSRFNDIFLSFLFQKFKVVVAIGHNKIKFDLYSKLLNFASTELIEVSL